MNEGDYQNLIDSIYCYAIGAVIVLAVCLGLYLLCWYGTKR